MSRKILYTVLVLPLFVILLAGQSSGQGMMVDKIYLIPIGKVNEAILEGLISALSGRFGMPCEIGRPLAKPQYAYNARRRQYHSSPILDEISKSVPADATRVLGVTELDLYVPELNFIFGQAQMPGRRAVISLARLSQEFWGLPEDRKLLMSRAIKEAVHELGHTFGLEHCPDPGCVMHFSNSLADTDKKGPNFCPRCTKLLEQNR